ncbi:penicillin acylase family protein [Streptomyces lacrimifluminis]|uniref:penicillin acylase family protein n=1 Tax=Streptomyces lacrimifluminis TaxID=1500077 RepID=UPI0027E4F39F|nr:penicillin acylase family protein [Streptomyces lacrimifluminis]
MFGPVRTAASPRTRGAVADVAALAAKGGLTVADLQRQQFANRSTSGALAAADAARACAALPGGTATGSNGTPVDVSQACGVLASWDRTMNSDSRGGAALRPVLAAVARRRAVRAALEGAVLGGGPGRHPQHAQHGRAGLHQGPRRRGDGAARGGHPVERPARRPPVPRTEGSAPAGRQRDRVPGRLEQDRAGVDKANGGYRDNAFGSSHIQAVGWDGSRCPVARTLLTYSQSSNADSPHFADQTRLFSAEKWVKARFCEKDILSSPALRVIRVHS